MINDWDTTAAAIVEDWDAAQQWSDTRARQVQQANNGHRAVELLRRALAGTKPRTPQHAAERG
jgi:hypothetical protein